MTLQLEDGTVLGLLGQNGAGKTTLIKILTGLLKPDAGSGTVLGYDLLREHREIRARVSLVSPTSDVGIDNNLTVKQNLEFWTPVYGLFGTKARARIEDLLERLYLTDKADAWAMHLSAGQRQRLALARSILGENRLVFLDEPTNKLDMEGVRSIRNLIAQLNQALGVTIVLTTHVMEEAEELCSQIALMREGELIAHMKTDDLLRSLSLSRPIRVTIRRGDWDENWSAALFSLPSVTECKRTLADAPGLQGFEVKSLNIRETTPALLSLLRTSHLQLVNMVSHPVTLQDVFFALARREGGTRNRWKCSREAFSAFFVPAGPVPGWNTGISAITPPTCGWRRSSRSPVWAYGILSPNS